jgi:hypothetical protein
VKVKVEVDKSGNGEQQQDEEEVVMMEDGEGAGGSAQRRQEEDAAREQLVVGFNLLAPDAELFMTALKRDEERGLNGPPCRAV